MNNKLIIAAAGAGKTSYIVDAACAIPSGNVLILTYTIANENEIRNRFFEKNGGIPKRVTIQTWFSFLLQHGVRPYQDTLKTELFDKHIGFFLSPQASGVKIKAGGSLRYNIYYAEDAEFLKHYFTSDMKIFSDKISKFVCRTDQESQGLVFCRIKEIFQHIFIDEVQDLAGYDLDIVKSLCASVESTLLVGDPRQVAYLTHNEKKYAQYAEGKIQEYIRDKFGRRIPCEVDNTSLRYSHRNNSAICEFSSRLFPNFPSSISCNCANCRTAITEHLGIFALSEDHVELYIKKYSPLQLTWDQTVNCSSSAPRMNLGESKGLSHDRVLIYPTKEMSKWLRDNTNDLEYRTRARLYIGITRARYSVAFVLDRRQVNNISNIEIWAP